MNKFKECNQCPHEFNDKNLEPCKDCVPKKKTNADRIRAMSDEELAEFLNMLFIEGQIEALREQYPDSVFNRKESSLKWLQSEAE